MHAAAPAATAARLLGIEFRHERAGRHAFGQRVAVPPMGAGDPVLMSQVGANPHGRRLLPHVKVDETGHFPFFVKNPGGLLEMTEQEHFLVKPKTLLLPRIGSAKVGDCPAGALLGTGFRGRSLRIMILEREGSGGLSFFLF